MHHFNRFNLFIYPFIQVMLWRSGMHTGLMGVAIVAVDPGGGGGPGEEGGQVTLGFVDVFACLVTLALVTAPMWITSPKFFVNAVRVAYVCTRPP